MTIDKKSKWILAGALFMLAGGTDSLFAASCCAPPLPEAAAGPQISVNAAPDFTVPTLNGGSFTLSEQRGKPVVLFVMAYWCATCFREAGELARLYDTYRGRIEILALDVDPSSTPDGLAAFKRQAGDPPYRWGFDRGGKVSRIYKIKALETTIIFNQAGEIVFTDARPTSYETLEGEIRRLLK